MRQAKGSSPLFPTNIWSEMIDPKGYIGSAIELSTGDFCGEEGHWLSKLIPQSYFFGKVNLREPCKRHDYMYGVGKTDRDKMVADLYFLCNLLITMIGLDSERLKFIVDTLITKLDKAYSDKVTHRAWMIFWEGIKDEVSEAKRMCWFKKWLRYNWAKSYYEAVEIFGFDAYWKNKRMAEN